MTMPLTEPVLVPRPDHEPEPQAPKPSPVSLDVGVVQARMDALNARFGSMRLYECSFRVDWPCTRLQYEAQRKRAVDKWVRLQDKKGFTLQSKVHIRGPFNAYGTSGDWYGVPQLDKREFRARAGFTSNAKPVRTEITGIP